MAHARYWADEIEALARCVRAIREARSELGPDAAVFLACDAGRVEAHVRKAIPDLVTRPKLFKAEGRGELHNGVRYSEVQGAHDALIEMFLLARSATLVRYPPGSYFSFYASAFVARQISPPPPWKRDRDRRDPTPGSRVPWGPPGCDDR
jgi:hypothetical protein